MDTQLKVKHGLKGKIVPFISLILLIVCVVFYALGMVDFRTKEQKIEDALAEYMSQPYIQETLDAAFIVCLNTSCKDIEDVISITHLKGSKYFSAKYQLNNNEYEFYYDLSKNKKVSKDTWTQEVGKIASYLLFSGDKTEILKTISVQEIIRTQKEIKGE